MSHSIVLMAENEESIRSEMVEITEEWRKCRPGHLCSVPRGHVDYIQLSK